MIRKMYAFSLSRLSMKRLALKAAESGQLYRPNIGLLNANVGPVGDWPLLTGEMTPYEDALAAEWLGLDYVIPTDFGTVDAYVEAFPKLMNNMTSDLRLHVEAVLLRPGEILTYPER